LIKQADHERTQRVLDEIDTAAANPHPHAEDGLR